MRTIRVLYAAVAAFGFAFFALPPDRVGARQQIELSPASDAVPSMAPWSTVNVFTALPGGPALA